jgi:hypothetical protein
MKRLILLFTILQTVMSLHALVINEVMSNPVGDDSGREWIEVYNNTESDIDLTALTISIKGGSFVPVTPVSGGTTINPHGYVIIGSIVSGATRFMQDYGTYSGPLFRSSISLVNTGVTSLELKLQGQTVDALASYTAAKEGSTYSLVNGNFVTASPSPGAENKAAVVEEDTVSTATPSLNQVTLPQAAPPSADIVLYLPQEKVVVAGAPSLFSVYSTNRAGKSIDNMSYIWSFGDGGQSAGSSTLYRYFYPGRYIAQVEGTNGFIAGTGRVTVRVVAPDISISPIGVGKYGSYIDITNPNQYDLDISFWKLSIDGALFTFPKNTLLTNGVTRFPSLALGFASTTISSSTLIKLLFPSMDEVLRVYQGEASSSHVLVQSVVPSPALTLKKLTKPLVVKSIPATATVLGAATQTITIVRSEKKDVRVATFIRSLFGK